MRGLGHGQIWWADLDKIRPVLVVTRSRVAPRLSRVVVAPITTVVRNIDTEVPLGKDEGVVEGSVANTDNLQLVAVDRLLRRAGRLSDDRWGECCAAVAHMMACR